GIALPPLPLKLAVYSWLFDAALLDSDGRLLFFLDQLERILAGDRLGLEPPRLDRVVVEHAPQLGAGAADAALHGADLAAADPCRVLVVEAAGADQDQRLAVMIGQLPEGAAEVAELEARLLGRTFRRLVDREVVDRGEARLAAAALVVEQVPE